MLDLYFTLDFEFEVILVGKKLCKVAQVGNFKLGLVNLAFANAPAIRIMRRGRVRNAYKHVLEGYGDNVKQN